MENQLEENLIDAWINMNSILKDTRMTKSLTYNEAIIMRLLTQQYKEDGIGLLPVQIIIRKTNMLKSLVNRTLTSLESQGYIEKVRNNADARTLSIKPIPEKLAEFEEMHQDSLGIAKSVIEIIGEDGAENFIESCSKLLDSEFKF